jgi:hypothetical protein
MVWLATNTYRVKGGQRRAMVVRDVCPECGAQRFKENGYIHNGKQNHQCKVCGRQFVLDAANHVIAEEQHTLVERLLREKISLHGICRAVGVSILKYPRTVYTDLNGLWLLATSHEKRKPLYQSRHIAAPWPSAACKKNGPGSPYRHALSRPMRMACWPATEKIVNSILPFSSCGV